MLQIVFATANSHKLKEVQHLLPHYKLIGLTEIGCTEEIPEPYETLEENALAKARYIYTHYKMECIADDTGLEVDILNGAPGVYSARYAGDEKNHLRNIEKLLYKLQGVKNRKAQFRTVIALVFNKREYLFEGKVRGQIIYEKKGIDGFGYDPVFLPDGYSQTFAEMPLGLKNQISHRGEAIRKLIDFLENQSK